MIDSPVAVLRRFLILAQGKLLNKSLKLRLGCLKVVYFSEAGGLTNISRRANPILIELYIITFTPYLKYVKA